MAQCAMETFYAFRSGPRRLTLENFLIKFSREKKAEQSEEIDQQLKAEKKMLSSKAAWMGSIDGPSRTRTSGKRPLPAKVRQATKAKAGR